MMPVEPYTTKFAAEIHGHLLTHYGKPVWRIPLSPLDELISTILSQNTNDQNRDRAFQALKSQFLTWEDVRNAETRDVVDAIRPAGLANQKGPRIQKVLNEIHNERGNLDLSFLNGMPRDEVRQWLLKFNGVGPKTAAIVLQFSLDKPAFPVDTHIYRVTGRLGLRPEKMNVEDAHTYLEEAFHPDSYYAVHLNLIRLGRELCHPRKPECSLCPLLVLCPFGKLYVKSETPG
jgi:endonuclease III